MSQFGGGQSMTPIGGVLFNQLAKLGISEVRIQIRQQLQSGHSFIGFSCFYGYSFSDGVTGHQDERLYKQTVPLIYIYNFL
jgi:hypothetical protein